MAEIQAVGLTGLAAEINNEHSAFVSGLAHAVKAGELLLQAKAIVAHGDWASWLADNVTFSERTARGYMRVAEHWPELSKTATVADLTLRGALQLLSKPRIPEYEIHEYGKIFPMVTDGELDAWGQSYKENGYLPEYPIVLYEGKILDGKCRYEACKRAGVLPTYATFPDDFPSYSGGPIDFLWSGNMCRGSYTADQRAMMGVDIERKLLAESAAFVDVGKALLEIRDSRLYREGWGAFEDYCRDRWGFSADFVRETLRFVETATPAASPPNATAQGGFGGE